ncbi:prospero homeobox 3 [Synchiropus splendidus]|uniref:prospero homeobox 3 n=1 Tax=Synchiropus splendidus TaxID=270530 RepID=UPI00237EC36F|nr:prospero homeobox 3 [Synchiropus splendidus]
MMDSSTNLFDGSATQTFAPPHCPTGQRPAPSTFRPTGFPLIHHLVQPGGSLRRIGAQVSETNLNKLYLDEDGGAPDGLTGEATEGGEKQGEESILRPEKRCHDATPVPDIARVKRTKFQQKDGELEEGGRNRERGRQRKRREKEELKEQLEEARERLQALQEKVWRAFGEKNMAKEGRKRGRTEEKDVGIPEDEDGADRAYDEDDEEIEKEAFALLSPFENFGGQKEEQQQKEKGSEGGRGELQVEGVIEGLWLDCGGLVRREWDGLVEEEGEDEGGQKFAEALKEELGGAVARVIDRVLRLYTETSELKPSSPPAAISFLTPTTGGDEGREQEVWRGLLLKGGEETQEAEGEKRQKASDGLPPSHRTDKSDESMQKSPDLRKCHPFLGPPPLPHPVLVPPHPKDSSTFQPSSSSSTSSSSFPAPPPPPPPPPPPLPLPLLHYSMQQLFSRSIHPPPLPHLPPTRSSDTFLEFSSHPSFAPLSLLGHLDPTVACRDRERGMRGDGGMRAGIDGDLYLAGGIHEGLSPCHLKKAKLMFFYTRYPSSNTLKTFFPDVKFNRCVTSQMIKWFSNFREFFYIQMERFARQAVREALNRDGAPRLARDSQLRVNRDSELYRILNMHYNKSNIYQVPDRFMEVAEVALREFYSAIWTGRDSDPCWKKGIYKIICKLDSPVPDTFRLPGCPVG